MTSIYNNMSNILEKQPVLNIGCLGSVSHGKSTMVKLITGKATQQHSKEKIKNITMKVGYANAKVYQNNNDEYTIEKTDKLVHHFSFVDCPGHHELIEIMMSGANLMDCGIVVVAGNQKLEDQPQLKQHLITAKLIGLKKIIFVLNKLDLISKNLALERKYNLVNYLEKFDFSNPIIIPMALNLGLNKEYLLNTIMSEFPPDYKQTKKNMDTIFSISRSFDVNKNGIPAIRISGGVVGGSVLSGKLSIGDKVIIYPGQIKYDKTNNKWINKVFKSEITSLKSENDNLKEIISGGLTAVGLKLDPYFTQGDKLKGQILSRADNKDIKCIYELKCNFISLDDRVLELDNIYNLQIGCNNVKGNIISMDGNNILFQLSKMVSVYDDIKILVSNKTNNMIDLIGFGTLI